jgi:hypothetical protein
MGVFNTAATTPVKKPLSAVGHQHHHISSSDLQVCRHANPARRESHEPNVGPTTLHLHGLSVPHWKQRIGKGMGMNPMIISQIYLSAICEYMKTISGRRGDSG